VTLSFSARDRAALAAAATALALFAAAASLAPLAAYTLILAVFGLPHVASELRYVDRRFGRRIDPGFLAVVALLLAAIVAVRASVVFRLLPADIGAPAELGGVALLALGCAGGAAVRKGLALAVGLTIGAGALAAPFETSVALAVLHNFTPLGFLWQIAPRPGRGRVMTLACFAFLVLPLLAATGLLRAALEGLGGVMNGFDPLAAGPLSEQLRVYVPAPLLDGPRAADLFTASVVAQGAHYLAVIVVLPALLDRFEPHARGLAPWPAGPAFAALCLVAAAPTFAAFAHDFSQGRAIYGIAAAVHAWIEIPILILALTSDHSTIARPTSSDAELAASDTIIARSIRSAAIQAIRPPSISTTSDSSASTDGQKGNHS